MSNEHWIDKALEYLLRTGFRRFLSSLIYIGATLLGLSWVDVITLILENVAPDSDTSSYASIAPIAGIVLILTGVLGRILLHVISERGKKRQAARKLLGRLKVLMNGFKDANVTRDAGYYNEEIIQCQKAAVAYIDIADSPLVSHEVVAAVANPKFDASKKSPYIDVTLEELDSLISELEAHHGIG